ncbi:nuclear transcription factor Y subunit beta-like [Mizuhopecten yessoensis]|uniref:Nuclear transcription factor Y subunit beta n=2 Tax=Mizuhopecten yessoensis TaxID=6573 RepID=A0A210Q499_MIZYE|nr:nuclear transcription factor Y subunit beta-like [Mizuhopecten yessoensis]OWF43570.1 Nuclear transcription factor Y subunit beta [Mizuhopecten yessoensis]
MDGNSGDSAVDSLGDSMFSGSVPLQDDGEETLQSVENDDEPRDNEPLREQDRFLPIANVARIMKKSIPKSGKIAKDAKECVQECVSEFISFITSEASERCHQEKRKTINGEDILFAMSTLGFDSYVEPLKLYLQKYRESAKGDKSGQLPEEGRLEDLSEDSFNPHTLQSNILATDQQNVIYTATYPSNQISQQITFG